MFMLDDSGWLTAHPHTFPAIAADSAEAPWLNTLPPLRGRYPIEHRSLRGKSHRDGAATVPPEPWAIVDSARPAVLRDVDRLLPDLPDRHLARIPSHR